METAKEKIYKIIDDETGGLLSTGKIEKIAERVVEELQLENVGYCGKEELKDGHPITIKEVDY